MFKEFKKFILRGNLVDLAIGFTVGAAFSTVARSLVNDILMPPIGYLLGSTDFSNLMLVLKEGTVPPPYNSPEQAQAVGAITINWGLFVNNVFALLIVALSMFLVIKAFNRLENQIGDISGKKEKDKPQQPSSKKCPYCLSNIAYQATRCPECTSKLKKSN